MSRVAGLKLRDSFSRLVLGGARGITSLRARAIRGSLWTTAGYAVQQSIRLGKNIVLAWLLFPEAFGLMTLVAVVIQGLNMISDVGLAPNVIQSRRGIDRSFLNTIFTIQILRGLAIWLIACILSVPVAWTFSRNDPAAWQLVHVLPVAAFSCVIKGLESPGLLTLNREIRIERLTALEVIYAIIAALVMIAWALVHRSVWALVAGSLIAAGARAVLSYRMVPELRVRPQWDHSCAREIFAFGKWIFVSTLITFLAMQADRLLLGGLVPIETIGIYGFGVMLAMVPGTIIGKVSARVLFPTLAEVRRRSPDAPGRNLSEAQAYLLPPAMLMTLSVILLAPAFFATLYDERYHDAGWIAQLFAVGVWISMLGQIAGSVLLAAGRAGNLAAGNSANLIGTIAGCLAGYSLLGLPGFILGYATGNLAGLSVLVILVKRLGLSIWRQHIFYSVLLAVLVALGLVLPDLIVLFWPDILPQVWWQVIVATMLLLVVAIRILQKMVMPRNGTLTIASCSPLANGPA